jgi:hypothetical protein
MAGGLDALGLAPDNPPISVLLRCPAIALRSLRMVRGSLWERAVDVLDLVYHGIRPMSKGRLSSAFDDGNAGGYLNVLPTPEKGGRRDQVGSISDGIGSDRHVSWGSSPNSVQGWMGRGGVNVKRDKAGNA